MKLFCDDCGWRGDDGSVLRAPSPFDPEEELWGCPSCKSVPTFVRACDEPECWRPATCGTQTPTGYRRTCGSHMPRMVEGVVDCYDDPYLLDTKDKVEWANRVRPAGIGSSPHRLGDLAWFRPAT